MATLSMTPDISAETWLGAAGCARGSQTWRGTTPALVASPERQKERRSCRAVESTAAARRAASRGCGPLCQGKKCDEAVPSAVGDHQVGVRRGRFRRGRRRRRGGRWRGSCATSRGGRSAHRRRSRGRPCSPGMHSAPAPAPLAATVPRLASVLGGRPDRRWPPGWPPAR